MNFGAACFRPRRLAFERGMGKITVKALKNGRLKKTGRNPLHRAGCFPIFSRLIWYGA